MALKDKRTEDKTEVEEWLDNLDPDKDQARSGEHMRRIIEARDAVAEAEEELRRTVSDARRAGDSWAMIGTALGVSRQAAYQRFGSAGAKPATFLNYEL